MKREQAMTDCARFNVKRRNEQSKIHMRRMIGQEKLYDLLSEMGIEFQYIEHPPTPTIEEARKYWTALDGKHCKNIFLRNHKGNKHYLVVLDCDKSIDMHDLEHRLGEGKLSFASAERMNKYLGLRPGSVSPFGLINDANHEVILFLDSNLKTADKLAFHPNDNRASLSISREDLMRFIERMGNRFEWKELY